jgi:hypothetical protein
LIEFGARVRFRHPLVRSAVCRSADGDELGEVHRALAEVTDPELDPDRRAWHRAHAAVGPDETVALELKRSAARAQARGGLAATAAFLERAADLTPDPARRGARALAAASAKLDAGAPQAAQELLAAAELTPLDELERARLERLRAGVAFHRRRRSDALPLLLGAARRLAPLDAALARDAHLDAFGAAIFAAGPSSDRETREAAAAARAAPPGPQPPRPTDLLLDGLAIRFTDGYEASVPALRRALDAFEHDRQRGREGVVPRVWLGWPVANDIWDDGALDSMTSWAVRSGRDRGELTLLTPALLLRAGAEIFAGAFDAASALVDEATAITQEIGFLPLTHVAQALAGWRGRPDLASVLID